MPKYKLIEYSDNYSKTSGILWKYCRDEPAVDDNGAIADFTEANAITDSFKIKEKRTGKWHKKVETVVPLEYVSNFWRTVEMTLIDSEINLDLNCFKKCVIVTAAVADQSATFSETDTKLYITVVTLSTQDNSKLLEQLKSAF